MLAIEMTGSGTLGQVRPGWEVVEEVTPFTPGDTRGAVTRATFSARANDDSRFVADNPITLTTDWGVTEGRVTEVSISGFTASVSVAGALQQFVVDHQYGPISEFTYVGSWAPDYAGLRPVGAVVDADDNLHVLLNRASTGDCVYVFDRSGNLIDTWGAYGLGTSGLYGVSAIAIDSAGNFYIGNANSARISVFDSSYAYVSQFGSSGTGDGQFQNIAGIAVGSAGDVYVTDQLLYRVQRFDSSHAYVSKWGSMGTGNTQFLGPYGVGVDADGYVYVTDRTSNNVKKFDGSGTWQWTVSANYPLGLSAVSDHIYVTTSSGILKLRVADGSQALGTELLSSVNLAVAVAVTDSTIFAVDGSAIVGYENRVYRYLGPGPIPLSAAIEYYVADLVGDLTTLPVDFQATDQPVVIPAWRGEAWAMLKQLCATYGVQFDYLNSQLVVTDTGSTEIPFPASASSITTTPINLTGGQVVDLRYLQPVAGEATMLRRDPFTVASASTTIATLVPAGSPVWVANPTVSDTVPAPDGSYNVRDASGALVSAATWTGAGGSITARVVDVAGTIALAIKAANLAGGDFTIEELSVVGSGVVTTPITFVRSGSQGNPYGSPFADTLDRVLSRGHYGSMQDPNVVLSFTCAAADLPGIGQTVGRVMPYDGSRYRVSTVRWGNLTATVTAERYVTAGDVEDLWAGQTVGDFDAFWAGYSAGDMQVQPLRSPA